MLMDLTWSFFEKTGSIEAFLEYNMLKSKVAGEENADESYRIDN